MRAEDPENLIPRVPSVSLTRVAEACGVNRNALTYIAKAYQIPFSVVHGAYTFLRQDAIMLARHALALDLALEPIRQEVALHRKPAKHVRNGPKAKRKTRAKPAPKTAEEA